MSNTESTVSHRLISPEHRQELINNPIPVFCLYQRQNQPQHAYIEIDPSAEYPVRASYNANIGNGVSEHYYHGHEIHLAIQPDSTGESILQFIDEHAAEIQQVIDGYSSDWNGQNNVGTWTETAGNLIEQLQQTAEQEISQAVVIHDIDSLNLDIRFDTDAEEMANSVLDNLVYESMTPYFDYDDLVEYINSRIEQKKELLAETE